MENLTEGEAQRRTQPMEGAVVARNIWALHDHAKETRQRCVEAEKAVNELKGQVAMLRQEIAAVTATANAALGLAQGGRSTS